MQPWPLLTELKDLAAIRGGSSISIEILNNQSPGGASTGGGHLLPLRHCPVRPGPVKSAYGVAARSSTLDRTLWVPKTASPYATCEYSWIRPPSRSRRRARTFAAKVGGCGRLAGGSCCSA